MVGGGRPRLPEILGQSDRVGAKSPIFDLFSPKSPKGGLKNPKRPISIKNALRLLLITNRKSHTGFRLVPTSMTLNDLERLNSPYFEFFTEFDRFSGRLYHSA